MRKRIHAAGECEAQMHLTNKRILKTPPSTPNPCMIGRLVKITKCFRMLYKFKNNTEKAKKKAEKMAKQSQESLQKAAKAADSIAGRILGMDLSLFQQYAKILISYLQVHTPYNHTHACTYRRLIC
jgi:hypothetical protein